MPMGTDKNKTKQVSVETAGPEDHAPHGSARGAILRFELTSRLPSDYRTIDPRFYYDSVTFSAVEVACEHLNRMIDAAKIRVCSV